MKPNYNSSTRATPSYQILVDGKPLSFRYLNEVQPVNPGTTAQNIRSHQHGLDCFAPVERLHSRRAWQSSTAIPGQEPMNDLRRQILNRALALTCRTTLRVEQVLESRLLDAQTVATERLFELGEQLQDILTLFSLLPVSKAARESRAFAPEQLREWQFEQLESVLEQLREASSSRLDSARRDVLQDRVLPWLDSMHNTLSLLNELLPAQRC